LPNCHVPAEIVMPFIQRYLASYETHGIESGAFNGKRSPAWLLAEAAGISPDTLHKYLNGRTRDISFYVIDRLLCAMDQPMSWYEWPLLPYYLAADLSEPPPGCRVCARESCKTEFHPYHKDDKYCSHACGQSVRRGRDRAFECRNGHLRQDVGYYVRANGKRECRKCIKNSWARKNAVRAEHRRAQRRAA
jgi:hypothetical protein